MLKRNRIGDFHETRKIQPEFYYLKMRITQHLTHKIELYAERKAGFKFKFPEVISVSFSLRNETILTCVNRLPVITRIKCIEIPGV